jgi:hypothetical protein
MVVVCASRSSSPGASARSTSALAPTSGSTAKEGKARNDPDPRDRRDRAPMAQRTLRRTHRPQFPTRHGRPLSRYTVGAVVSKRAAGSWPSPQGRRGSSHLHCNTNAMLSGPRAWTSRRSPCRSGTRAPRPLKSTSTPTGAQGASDRADQTPGGKDADTSPPARSSPSWKRANYVEHAPAKSH